MSLTRDQARAAMAAVFAAGRAGGMRPLAVAVVDAGGHVVAFEREDGAPVGRFEVARAKAHVAVMMGMGGRALARLAEGRPVFAQTLAGVFDGKLLPVPGGVLLRDASGAIVGALGVSGDTSDNDAEAGLEGAVAAGFTGEA